MLPQALAMTGGGLRCRAHVFALEELERQQPGFLRDIRVVGAASGGCIPALVIALGLPLAVMHQQFDHFQQEVSGFVRWWPWTLLKGYTRALLNLEHPSVTLTLQNLQTLAPLLEKEGMPQTLEGLRAWTLRDLHHMTGRRLVLSSADIRLQQGVFFGAGFGLGEPEQRDARHAAKEPWDVADDSDMDVPVYLALSASYNFPLLLPTLKIGAKVCIDGGAYCDSPTAVIEEVLRRRGAFAATHEVLASESSDPPSDDDDAQDAQDEGRVLSICTHPDEVLIRGRFQQRANYSVGKDLGYVTGIIFTLLNSQWRGILSSSDFYGGRDSIVIPTGLLPTFSIPTQAQLDTVRALAIKAVTDKITPC